MAAANKTQPTPASVHAHLAALDDPARRQDCEALAQLMARATGEPAQMWGSSIVGFGRLHYRYDSGREGETCRVGFASRKGDISLYGLHAAPDHAELLARLGRHKTGKGCLYLRRLSDVDLAVLEALVASAARAAA
ncbi:DUF1801 domain-containing protein [Roseateles sp. BYS87W]|uniref:DUF1801 domain-containing protein n=1 Tax=Pelomonas baiyunensis TaxID=3299026 RepID=A0ABW7H246_9BURK